MLQLKQIDKIPYVEYGNVYHQICYEGVNVVGATVYITHTERAKVDDTFFVSIHGSNVKASHRKEKSMSDAIRWAETQVCMNWDIGEVNATLEN